MTLKIVRVALVATLCLTLSAPAVAQNRRWADPYRQGRDAVKAGRYEDGIRLLEQAIKVEPRQEREKNVGPGDNTEYFPYYYLGVAYHRSGQLDKAAEAFRNSRACKCLITDLSKLQDNWEAQLAKDRAAAASTDPALGARLVELDGAMSAGRFNEAIALLDSIRSSHAAEYARRGLEKRRTEAERALASRLVQEGNQLIAAGDLNGAQARFQDAEKRSAGSGQAGLAEVRQRRTAAYTQFRQNAEAEYAAGRVDAALERLRQAEEIHPDQYAADGLSARAQEWRQALQKTVADDKVRHLLERARTAATTHRYAEAASLYGAVLSTQDNPEAKAWLDAQKRFITFRDRARTLHRDGQFEQARQALDDARRQNEARFTFEQLDQLLASIDEKLGSLPEEQIGPVRTALVAYLRGDARQARDVLEPIAQNGAALDPRVRAHVLAYLGVMYADLAFAARDESERASLRAKAVEQFKALLTVQPDYQLRESLISPRVREILEEVRIKR